MKTYHALGWNDGLQSLGLGRSELVLKGNQARGVEIGFHRRNRSSTSDAPGIGFDEMRLRPALKAATDLPGFARRAGTSLIHGLPSWVTTTVSPACAKPAIMSNPSTASCFVTVLMRGYCPWLEPSATANSPEPERSNRRTFLPEAQLQRTASAKPRRKTNKAQIPRAKTMGSPPSTSAWFYGSPSVVLWTVISLCLPFHRS